MGVVGETASRQYSFELGFSGHQRLHSHPVNNTLEEAP